MKLAIFGLGYVGATAAACLARDGHHVVGVDNNPSKVNAIAEGRLPFLEPGLDAVLAAAVASGQLTATVDPATAIDAADCSIICIGTPASADGSLNVEPLLAAIAEIAELIQANGKRHCLIIRSTVLPGTIDEQVVPIIAQRTGMTPGRDYGLAYFPEFFREGSAIADHDDPGMIVYSASDDATAAILSMLTTRTGTASLRTEARTAEAIKLLNNAWHAAKVGFANEMGLILKSMGVDSHQAFAALCGDTKLNMTPAYLSPGFAFGGSCLPKDLAAMRRSAHANGLETPHIDGLIAANRRQIDEAVRLIHASGHRSITLVGLAFKPGTDDLRNSPYLDLAAELVALGHAPRIIDRHVDPMRLTGANADHVAQRLPSLDQRLDRDVSAALDCDLLIVADRDQAEAHLAAIAAHRPAIIDLARSEPIAALGLRYEGICW